MGRPLFLLFVDFTVAAMEGDKAATAKEIGSGQEEAYAARVPRVMSTMKYKNTEVIQSRQERRHKQRQARKEALRELHRQDNGDSEHDDKLMRNYAAERRLLYQDVVKSTTSQVVARFRALGQLYLLHLHNRIFDLGEMKDTDTPEGDATELKRREEYYLSEFESFKKHKVSDPPFLWPHNFVDWMGEKVEEALVEDWCSAFGNIPTVEGKIE